MIWNKAPEDMRSRCIAYCMALSQALRHTKDQGTRQALEVLQLIRRRPITGAARPARYAKARKPAQVDQVQAELQIELPPHRVAEADSFASGRNRKDVARS